MLISLLFTIVERVADISEVSFKFTISTNEMADDIVAQLDVNFSVIYHCREGGWYFWGLS